MNKPLFKIGNFELHRVTEQIIEKAEPVEQENKLLDTALTLLSKQQAQAASIVEGVIPSDHVSIEQDGYKSASRLLQSRGLLVELYSLVFSVAELRHAIYAVRREVFRRGLNIKPAFTVKCAECGATYDSAVEKCEAEGCSSTSFIRPDAAQKELLKAKLSDVNEWNQSLLDVLRELEDDINIVDDFFLVKLKQYKIIDGKLHGQVVQIYRHDPCSIEFDLDKNGRPGVSHCACRIHRDLIIGTNCDEVSADELPTCVVKGCGLKCEPLMYKADYMAGTVYLFSDEVIHASKFSPSKLYGFPPVLTVLDIAMAVAGADKSFFRMFYKRKLPRGMIISATPDPEGLKAERKMSEERLKKDPDYVPWIIVKTLNTQRGQATQWVNFSADPTGESYKTILDVLRIRVPQLWGVVATTGQSTATQDLNAIQVQSHAIEDAQLVYNERVLPSIVNDLGITDWTLELPTPEEKLEEAALARTERRARVAAILWRMGFDIKFDSDGQLIWAGSSKPPSTRSVSDEDLDELAPKLRKPVEGTIQYDRDKNGFAVRNSIQGEEEAYDDNNDLYRED